MRSTTSVPTAATTATRPFARDVDCGAGGTCNEEAQTCDCDEGFVFDPGEITCNEDLCYGAQCGFGELCDPADGSCLEACTPDTTVGDFQFCAQSTLSSVGVVLQYQGAGTLDLAASTIRLNADPVAMEDVEVERKKRSRSRCELSRCRPPSTATCFG